MSRNIEDRAKRFVRKEEKIVRKEEELVEYEWKHYKTFLIALFVVLTLELYVTGYLQAMLTSLGEYEYVGAFFGGFFYTYGITTPFSIAVLLVVGQKLNPLLVAIVGAFGSLISEYIIYTFARKQAKRFIKKNSNLEINRILKSGFLKKISPLIAGLIIASPLPDELAAGLMGIECYDVKKFLLLTFSFNFIGILLISGIGRIF
jgi:hypothetical protein